MHSPPLLGEGVGEGADLGEPGSDGVAEAERWVTEAIAAWPESGRNATRFAPCVEVWPEQAGLAGGAEALLGCIRAFAADPFVQRRTHGAGGLQRWLKDGGWRSYVGVVAEAGQTGRAVPGGVFPGDPAIRAEVVRLLGPTDGPVVIDPCGWDGERRRVLPRTSYQARQLAKLWSAELDWTVGEVGRG